MIHRVIEIAGWVMDVLFAVDRYDKEGVLGCLYDAGAPQSIMKRAGEIMDDSNPNSGFTFTNPERRRGVVVIGPTTSEEERINTFVHEIRHLSDGVSKALGFPLDSEPPAYMSGDMAMELADIICILGCGCGS